MSQTPLPSPILTLRILGKFLIGDREGIETVAQCGKVILVAALFIVSAGLARNYDHHLLWEELLWIGGPFGMAFFSSGFIFCVLKIFGGLDYPEEKFGNYLSFLRCFLMTAPMAWLYGFPIEQWSGVLTASIFNFTVLMIVSFWRVALMIRVTSVLFGHHPARAFALIAIPASVEMFFATLVQSINIVGIMSGVTLDEGEQFLLTATGIVTMGSVVLFVIAIIVGCVSRKFQMISRRREMGKIKISRMVWGLAVLATVGWLVLAVPHQKRLLAHLRIENFIRADDFAGLSSFLEGKTRSDFPKNRKLYPWALTSHRSPNSRMKILLSEEVMPSWFEREIEQEVLKWIDEKDRPENSLEMEKSLYEEIQNHPRAQELADRLTPGVRVDQLFSAE